MTTKPLQYFDEHGNRYLACPMDNCPGYMISGVGGESICVVCNRTMKVPDPPVELCPSCEKPTRLRHDGEPGRVCDHCITEVDPWEDRWRKTRNGEKAVVQLVSAWNRLREVPSAIGPVLERLQLGTIQITANPTQYGRAHEILADFTVPWERLDGEDQLHLVMSVPDIVARLDGEACASKTGREFDIIDALSEHRLERFREAHGGATDSVSEIICKYGLKTRGGHLDRQGRCGGCSKWWRAQRRGRDNYHMRARCRCGSRIKPGIIVEGNALPGLYGAALARWESQLRGKRG